MIVGQRRSDMLALGVAKLRGSAPPCPLGVAPAGQVVCWARSARQKPEFTGELNASDAQRVASSYLDTI